MLPSRSVIPLILISFGNLAFIWVMGICAVTLVILWPKRMFQSLFLINSTDLLFRF